MWTMKMWDDLTSNPIVNWWVWVLVCVFLCYLGSWVIPKDNLQVPIGDEPVGKIALGTVLFVFGMCGVLIGVLCIAIQVLAILLGWSP